MNQEALADDATAVSDSLIQALAPLVASPKESVLIFDVDGTLAPIVADPASARVPVPSLDLLRELTNEYAGVGLVTGRSLEGLEHILNVPDLFPRLHTIGNHGIEYGHNGSVALDPEILEEMPRISKLRRALAKASEIHIPGVILEDKGFAFSLHYRKATDPTTEEKIARLVDRLAMGFGFGIMPGRKVLELRPYYAGNKGAGIKRIVDNVAQQLGKRPAAVLFAGDDITDIDGFEALSEIRSDGGGYTVSIAVAGSKEQAPEVLSSADHTVDGTDGMQLVLQLLTAVTQ